MTSTNEYERRIAALTQENQSLRNLLEEITRSKGWRLIEAVRNIKSRLSGATDTSALTVAASPTLSRPSAPIAPVIPDEVSSRLSALEEQVKLLEKHHVTGFWHALDKIEDLAPASKIITCLICDHADVRSGFEVVTSKCIFDGGRLERFKCPTCDCIFGASKFLELTDELTDLDYRILYSRYREGETAEYEKRTFRSLNPSKSGPYVNWGAGAWNSTTTDLRSEGFDLWAFEPSAPASHPFVVTDRNALSDNLAGIFSHNVIEHFRNPIEQFRSFHSLLAEGARMAHSTPCYEYLYPFTRFHTVFYIGRSVDLLAERTGFKIIDRVKDGEYMNVIFEKVASRIS